MRTGRLEADPARFLGSALKYLGFKTLVGPRRRNGATRLRTYSLDIASAASILCIAQRHNLRERGFGVPSVEAIDPKVAALLEAMDPTRNWEENHETLDMLLEAG